MATDEQGDRVPHDPSTEADGVASTSDARVPADDAGAPADESKVPADNARVPAALSGPRASGPAHEPTPSFGARLGTGIRELVVVVVMALALSFVVKTWLVQAFYIPSESMEDTLVVNDRVVVNKLTPGVMDLQRGDVVVFSDPDHWLVPTPKVDHGPVVDAIRNTLIFVGLLPNPSDDHLIKRVIGMPGDHVVCCDAKGKLTVNGVAITEPYVKPGVNPSDRQFDITVPKDKVWVMGDNRSNSEDSRFHDAAGDGSDGAVPIKDVTGRAFAIVWPFGRMSWLSDYPDTFAKVPSASAASTPTVTTTTSSP